MDEKQTRDTVHMPTNKIQLPTKYMERKRRYLEEVLIKFEHTDANDTAVMDYIRLLESDSDMENFFQQEYLKSVGSHQSTKGPINMKDPVITDYGRHYYENILKVLDTANEHNHTELVKMALFELKQLLIASHQMERLRPKIPVEQQPHQVVPQRSSMSIRVKAGPPGKGDSEIVLEAEAPAFDKSIRQYMVRVKKSQFDDMVSRLQAHQREINELSSRLSRFASDQMSSGNPNIADLSDRNRPTKIGEHFGELYDNEWSDAFESLSDFYKGEEDRAIQQLLHVIMMAYTFCSEVSKEQHDHLVSAMKHQIQNIKYKDKGQNPMQQGIPENSSLQSITSKYSKNFRKECAPLCSDGVVKLFIHSQLAKEEWNSKISDPRMNKYISRCVEVIWLMVIQDPPMVLVFAEKGEKLDKKMFSNYNGKGKKVNYTVWPTVLLHERGPIVSKGYANPVM